jgi:hypothetical protein
MDEEDPKEQGEVTGESKRTIGMPVSGSNKKMKFVYLTGLLLVSMSMWLIWNPPLDFDKAHLAGNIYVFSVVLGLIGLVLFLYGGRTNPFKGYQSSKPVIVLVTIMLVFSIIWPIIQGRDVSIYSPGGLCANDLYSTTQMDSSGRHSEYIQLTGSSMMRLEQAIDLQGDSALQGLSDLTCLEYLNLAYTSVSDVSALKSLTNLKKVYLENTQVTKEGCDELKEALPDAVIDCPKTFKTPTYFPPLEVEENISAQEEQTEDESSSDEPALCSNSEYSTEYSYEIEYLEPKKGDIKLTSESRSKLVIKILKEGDSVLWGISDLTCLEYLDLGHTLTSDISPLRNLTNLRILILSDTKVSDVSPLHGLTKLKLLHIYNTQVPKENCEELQEELPDLGINYRNIVAEGC